MRLLCILPRLARNDGAWVAALLRNDTTQAGITSPPRQAMPATPPEGNYKHRFIAIYSAGRACGD